ncbi:MAG TPA: hypothetical protein VGG34_05140 [Opitutaceae bacterium]|jgi:hypothetical protein
MTQDEYKSELEEIDIEFLRLRAELAAIKLERAELIKRNETVMAGNAALSAKVDSLKERSRLAIEAARQKAAK